MKYRCTRYSDDNPTLYDHRYIKKVKNSMPSKSLKINHMNLFCINVDFYDKAVFRFNMKFYTYAKRRKYEI